MWSKGIDPDAGDEESADEMPFLKAVRRRKDTALLRKNQTGHRNLRKGLHLPWTQRYQKGKGKGKGKGPKGAAAAAAGSSTTTKFNPTGQGAGGCCCQLFEGNQIQSHGQGCRGCHQLYIEDDYEAYKDYQVRRRCHGSR